MKRLQKRLSGNNSSSKRTEENDAKTVQKTSQDSHAKQTRQFDESYVVPVLPASVVNELNARIKSNASNELNTALTTRPAPQITPATDAKYHILPSGKKVYTENRHRRTRSGNEEELSPVHESDQNPSKSSKTRSNSKNIEKSKNTSKLRKKKSSRDSKKTPLKNGRSDSITRAPNLLPSRAKKVKKIKRRMSQSGIEPINAALVLQFSQSTKTPGPKKCRNTTNLNSHPRSVQSARGSNPSFTFANDINSIGTPSHVSTLSKLRRQRDNSRSRDSSPSNSYSMSLSSPVQGNFDLRELQLRIQTRSMRDPPRPPRPTGLQADGSDSVGIGRVGSKSVFAFIRHSRHSSDTTLFSNNRSKEDIFANIALMRKLRPPPSIETSLSKKNQLRKLRLRNLPDIPILLHIISVSTARIRGIEYSVPRQLTLRHLCRKFSYENPRFIFNKKLQSPDTPIATLCKVIESSASPANTNSSGIGGSLRGAARHPLIVFNIKNKDKTFELSEFQVRQLRLQAELGCPALVARFLLQLCNAGGDAADALEAAEERWNEMLPSLEQISVASGRNDNASIASAQMSSLGQKIVRNHKKSNDAASKSGRNSAHGSRRNTTISKKNDENTAAAAGAGAKFRPNVSDMMRDLLPLTMDTQTLSSKYILATNQNHQGIDILLTVWAPYRNNRIDVVVNVYDTIAAIKTKINDVRKFACPHLLLFAPTKVLSQESQESQEISKQVDAPQNGPQSLQTTDLEDITDPSQLPLMNHKERLSTSGPSLQFDFSEDVINSHSNASIRSSASNAPRTTPAAAAAAADASSPDTTDASDAMDAAAEQRRKSANDARNAHDSFKSEIVAQHEKERLKRQSEEKSDATGKTDFDNIVTRKESSSLPGFMKLMHRNSLKNTLFSNNSNAPVAAALSAKDVEFIRLQDSLEEELNEYKADGIDFVQLRDDSCILADLMIWYEKNKNSEQNSQQCNFKTFMYAIPVSHRPRHMSPQELNDVKSWCLDASQTESVSSPPSVNTLSNVNNEGNSPSHSLNSPDTQQQGQERHSTEGALFEVVCYFDSVDGEYTKLFVSETMNLLETLQKLQKLRIKDSSFYYSSLDTFDVFVYDTTTRAEAQVPVPHDKILSQCMLSNAASLHLIVRRSPRKHGSAPARAASVPAEEDAHEKTLLGKMKRLGSMRQIMTRKDNNSNGSSGSSANTPNTSNNANNASGNESDGREKIRAKFSMSLATLSKNTKRSKSQPRNGKNCKRSEAKVSKESKEVKETQDFEADAQISQASHQSGSTSDSSSNNSETSLESGGDGIGADAAYDAMDEMESPDLTQTGAKASFDMNVHASNEPKTEPDMDANDVIEVESAEEEAMNSGEMDAESEESDEKVLWDPNKPMPPKPQAAQLVRKQQQSSQTSKILYRTRAQPDVSQQKQQKQTQQMTQQKVPEMVKIASVPDAVAMGMTRDERNHPRVRATRRIAGKGAMDRTRQRGSHRDGGDTRGGKAVRRASINETSGGMGKAGNVLESGKKRVVTRDEVSRLTRYKGSHDRAMKQIERNGMERRGPTRRVIDLSETVGTHGLKGGKQGKAEKRRNREENSK